MKEKSDLQEDWAWALVQAAPAVRQAIEEEAVAREYVSARYRVLINRKHVKGLSPEEDEELTGLQTTLDDMDEPFYDGIIKRLRTLVESSGAV